MTRPVANIVSLTLPLPPSVNAAFASGKAGSKFTRKTAHYDFWLQKVRDMHGNGSQLPVLAPGAYGLLLTLSMRMRGDIDNRIKLVSDILCRPGPSHPHRLGVVSDDGAMKAIYIETGTMTWPAVDEIAVGVVTLDHWARVLHTTMELRL